MRVVPFLKGGACAQSPTTASAAAMPDQAQDLLGDLLHRKARRIDHQRVSRLAQGVDLALEVVEVARQDGFFDLGAVGVVTLRFELAVTAVGALVDGGVEI